jgi:hypothetical protein
MSCSESGLEAKHPGACHVQKVAQRQNMLVHVMFRKLLRGKTYWCMSCSESGSEAKHTGACHVQKVALGQNMPVHVMFRKWLRGKTCCACHV